MAPSSSSALTGFLAGTNPSASATFVFISLVALWVLAQRLLALNVGQLFLYAMGVWLLKRGMIAFICCACCTFVAIGNWVLLTMNGRIAVEVNMAITSVLVAASVATIALAYRRWCRADLA
jgi:hypothetical protein